MLYDSFSFLNQSNVKRCVPIWMACISFMFVSVDGFSAASQDGNTWVEPSYCNPALFDEKEFPIISHEESTKQGVVRSHAFRLGKVVLMGVGVGDSKKETLIRLAETNSSESTVSTLKDRKYCTWYLNHPKGSEDKTRNEVAQTFNHKDVKRNPILLSESEAEQEFMNTLETTFDQEKNNFLSCVSEHRYLALGCNGMAHRGPTVFGMLLAFSGCTPEHALEITDQAWGLNGVKRKTRLAVIRKAYELGATRKESRKKLAQLFLD